MATLPPEFRAEPALALDGNVSGGQDGDFIRQLLKDAPAQMSQDAVLVLEIGNEREYFEAAFPHLEVVWLETSAGEDQVLLITRAALLAQSHPEKDGADQLAASAKFVIKPATTPQDYAAFDKLLREYAAKDPADSANSTIWQDLQDLPGVMARPEVPPWLASW